MTLKGLPKKSSPPPQKNGHFWGVKAEISLYSSTDFSSKDYAPKREKLWKFKNVPKVCQKVFLRQNFF